MSLRTVNLPYTLVFNMWNIPFSGGCIHPSAWDVKLLFLKYDLKNNNNKCNSQVFDIHC